MELRNQSPFKYVRREMQPMLNCCFSLLFSKLFKFSTMTLCFYNYTQTSAGTTVCQSKPAYDKAAHLKQLVPHHNMRLPSLDAREAGPAAWGGDLFLVSCMKLPYTCLGDKRNVPCPQCNSGDLLGPGCAASPEAGQNSILGPQCTFQRNCETDMRHEEPLSACPLVLKSPCPIT